MIQTNFLDSSSTVSGIFYVERSSDEDNPARINSPVVLNSTELSWAHERDVTTFSSVASQEPQIVTIESDSNEPTMKYWYGSQQPIRPPSLHDLNL